MALGDVVKKACKRDEEPQKTATVGYFRAIGLTAQDIEDVQEAWDREAEHRNRFYADERFRHYEMSPGAKILKAAFDDVLYKHHPEGLPSVHCDDYGDEP